MTNEIRSYGPGKFNTILDSYVYSVSLDGGCEDECGDSQAGGWYGIMRNGRTIFRDHDPLLESLNEAEQEQLTSCAGVIIREDSQGFVEVEYYDTKNELESAWADIMEDHGTEDEDGETEDEDEDEDNEPDEDSITTTDHKQFYQYGRPAFEIVETVDGTYMVLVKGFQIGGTVDASGAGNATFPSVDAAIKGYLDHEQFYPDVYFVSDHGNAHLIEYWKDGSDDQN